MRILKLRLSNLNSLSGTWEIDFTHPEYVNEGLFAITGPTGAGKTTILDAICLALYGQTPRLGRITKSDNDIMSRQHGECWAEVCFATEQGEFRVKWYQHRARRAADGALQQAQHVLADMTSGNILEETLSAVPLRVEALSGLNFDRFMRSMMLAQGQFAAFLNAKESERSELLEQITGTDIYAQISKRVFSRSKAEKDALTSLQRRVQDIQLLDEAGLQALSSAMNHKQNLVTQLKSEQQAKLALQHWVEKLARAQTEAKRLHNMQHNMQAELADFADAQSRLTQDRKVRPYASDLKQYQYLSEQQNRHEVRILQLTQQLEQLRPQLAQRLQQQQSAEQAQQQEQDKLQQMQPKLEAARDLDQKIALAAQEQRAANSTAESLHTQQEALAEQLNQLKAAQQSRQASYTQVNEWLAQHQHDEQLRTQVALIERDLKLLHKMDEQAQALREQREALRENYKQMAALPQAEAQSTAVSEKTVRLEMLAAEQQAQQQTVQQLKLQQRFESERQVLAEGEACPLCGATEHPLMHSPSTLVEPDLAGQLEQAEQQLQGLQQQLQMTQNELQALQLERAVSATEQQHKLNDFKHQGEQLNQELKRVQAERASIATAWHQVVHAHQLRSETRSEDTPTEQLKAIQVLLTQAAERFADEHKHAQTLAQQLRDDQQNAQHIQSQADTLAHRLSEAKTQATSSARSLEALRETRQTYFNGRDTRAVEQESQQALATLGKAAEQARQAYQAEYEQVVAKESELRHISQVFQDNQPTLEACRAKLQHAVTDLQLANLEALAAGLLADDEQQRLLTRADALQVRQQKLELAMQHNQQEINEANAHQPEDREANAQRLQTLENELNYLQREIGALAEQQRQDRQARQRFEQVLGEIARQQKVYDNWATLDGMIGSADGKKYRNFAQGLTFEIMIEYANDKLLKMSDRYILVRDSQVPLALNVVDDYQGGETRSTRNLSGGESFIVSLSLALGLAQMASSRVRVDSLFLDEGFGTLDPDTLDIALDTLASLRQDGKMIGLISHVETLKERIATQLQVRAGAAGHSQLQGPGVRAIK